MNGVVVPEIEDHLNDPNEAGVPDLFNAKTLKCFKVWHCELADGSIHQHTEVLDFKGVQWQAKHDSNYSKKYLNRYLNKEQYDSIVKTLEGK